MSFTYATLKTAIQDYTDNAESTFVSNLALFITEAEERVFKNVQLSLFRKNVTGDTTASNKYLNIPSDFLAPFSLSVVNESAHEFLEYKEVNFVQSFTPNPATTGTPRYYSLFGISNFILAPTPDAVYTAELHYYYRPASLTAGADSGTTWLSENAPNAMLYGSLVEAYTFMKGDPDLLNTYNQRFSEAIVSLKNFGEAKEVTDDYTTGMLIKPKQ
tara:strand:- start:1108 stop:1755 length:648 start_codon:yes stop_codon:yes gene_type:complete